LAGFLKSLEQVHVRGMNRRLLRLNWIAGFAIALTAFWLMSPDRAFGLTATTTTLAANSSTQACPTSSLKITLTTLTVTVTGTGGVPTGTVTIEDEAGGTPVPLASAMLNSSGQATVVLYLSNGSHTLLVVYGGDTTFQTSTSMPASAPITSQCNTSFAVDVAILSPSSSSSGMTLTAGQAGTAAVTIVPSQQFIASLGTPGAPAFITDSCSGLPSLASCTFTPESIEILPGQDAGIPSSMLIQTQGPGTSGAVSPTSRPLHKQSPIAWAVLLPGMLGLGGLAWGARRRAWLKRLALVALVGLVTTLGTTACSPLYYYYHHGPNQTPPTPAGTYNVLVTAQTSNGVTAITNSTTIVLTVN
jgi:hypothetical protein